MDRKEIVISNVTCSEQVESPLSGFLCGANVLILHFHVQNGGKPNYLI